MPCGPFRVGQGAHTANCGYFAAYVLMVHSQSPGYRPGLMTSEDVLAERDAFRRSRNLRPGAYFLTTTHLVDFLEELGLPGYRAIRYRGTPRFPNTVEGYSERIRAATNRSPGAILLLQRPGSSHGHYVSVLHNSGPNICCYDPALPQRSGLFAPQAFAQAFKDVTSFVIAR